MGVEESSCGPVRFSGLVKVVGSSGASSSVWGGERVVSVLVELGTS